MNQDFVHNRGCLLCFQINLFTAWMCVFIVQFTPVPGSAWMEWHRAASYKKRSHEILPCLHSRFKHPWGILNTCSYCTKMFQILGISSEGAEERVMIATNIC